MDQAGFAHTLGLIYDAAMAPERRPELLLRLGQDFGCHFAGMVASSADRSAYDGVAAGVDREQYRSFLRRFHQGNPFRVAAPHKFAGQIVETAAVIPRAVLERTEMYQAFFRPNDMGEGVGLTIWKGESGVQTISLMRPFAAGPFDAAEHALVRAYMPHLQRMALVARHLGEADLLVRSAYTALSAVQHPALLLDRFGRLVHANVAAEAVLRAGDGMAARRGLLVGATPAVTRQLDALIAAAARVPAIGGTMRLPRPSGKPPLALVAMPMRGLGDFVLAERPAVLLCVSDPGLRGAVQPALLTTMFGLTGAEAALAARLLAGQDLRAIAEARGRSVNTMRNLLARLMAKTDTNRQSDLVRLLDRLSQLPHDG